MYLSNSMRDALVAELDEYLEAISPEPESATAYMIEQLEIFADDAGLDDIIGSLEEDSDLDGPLPAALEGEMSSDAEFTFTGEECVILLEQLCRIEWIEEEDEPPEATDC